MDLHQEGSERKGDRQSSFAIAWLFWFVYFVSQNIINKQAQRLFVNIGSVCKHRLQYVLLGWLLIFSLSYNGAGDQRNKF